ncbi:ubiquitin-activating enzyme E1 C [Plasmodium vinckei petteri]|uniref:NEDD8-activating enzyme E1 catalytic subunit n=1 Tax=Plasmodium vinckei petteri TaxID=138298 RepID=W7AYR2_PLAVN|nr:ubiquitin-activating enzyme E1 C [Plasmodium vinckei petteri]CAD2101649.1 NEDD8-activating enzyme E1 catalytic subunit, putative [Plasmodium vinckei petteri]
MTSQISLVNVLVVGCGGIGNEVIKNLIYSDIKNISIVDYDVVELSNLHRQIFFTNKDIGEYKVNVICKKIKERYSDISIEGYVKKIEFFDNTFFENFNFIIGCLDNIDSRIYLNNLIFNLKNSVIYIDGGVEGFKASIKIINREKNFGCFQCTIENYPTNKNETIPVCSITNTPKNAEDCILYAMNTLRQNKEQEGGDALNINSEQDIKWIYNEAKKRANKFNIDHLTYLLTEQVIQNIIPTTISTLIIVASLMVNELNSYILMENGASQNNYSDILYVGDSGFYLYYYKIYKNPECVVCNKKHIHHAFKKTDTLSVLTEFIKKTYNTEKMSISSQSSILFITSKYLKNDYYNNMLNCTFQELIETGKMPENGYLNVQTSKQNFLLFLHFKENCERENL